MSWWDTGHGDDLTGDRPADIISGALNKVAAQREEAGRAKPTLDEFLSALAATLRERGEEFVEDARDYSNVRIVARPEPAGDSASPAPDRRLAETLAGALHAVARAYEERWQRKPRMRELLYTLAFVLRPNAGAWLSGSEGSAFDSIAAESWSVRD